MMIRNIILNAIFKTLYWIFKDIILLDHTSDSWLIFFFFGGGAVKKKQLPEILLSPFWKGSLMLRVSINSPSFTDIKEASNLG